MIICKNSNKFWNFDVISISLNVLRVPRLNWLLLFDLLIRCVSGACFNRTTTTFDGSQKGTEAGWQRWPWHDSKLTERETVDCDGRCCCYRCCCCCDDGATFAPTHTYTYVHSLTYSVRAREWERVVCEHTRVVQLTALLSSRSLCLSLPLPRSLTHSLSLSLALGLLARSRAWFISGRCVWYSFDC